MAQPVIVEAVCTPLGKRSGTPVGVTMCSGGGLVTGTILERI